MQRTQIIQFWRSIAEQSPFVKTFLKGDGNTLRKRVANAQRSKMEYPFLAVDVHEMYVNGVWLEFPVDVFIGAGIKPDDFKQIDDVLNSLHTHILEIEAFISKQKTIQIVTNTFKVIEDRESYTLDGVVGYYITLKMRIAKPCIAANTFILNNENNKVSFSWVQNGNNIELTNTSQILSNTKIFLYEYGTSQVQDKQLQTLIFEKHKASFYIRLQAEQNGVTYECKYYWHKNDNRPSGNSYPITSTKEIY